MEFRANIANLISIDTYMKKADTLAKFSGEINWRSQGDLNPCILREREVS